MTTQQHAAAVVLESIHVLTVDTTGARNLTRDATLANVSAQGFAVRYSINGAFVTLAAWINAISQLDSTPFDDTVALRVFSGFSRFVTVYSDLMNALIEKHDVLTSQNSPLAPDGAIIGSLIAEFQFIVSVYLGWIVFFAPTRAAELAAQGSLASDAFELAATHYPRPGAKAPELPKGKLNLPETPARK
ncbi:hypothetical protein BC628DRAFT_1423481 [Trametes gibbosa]|nr:hypothetical protein BC628DRAFT_1423481 [Trametes gibbosa]